MAKKYYLRQNVAVSPLINQWYVALPMATPIIYSLLLVKSQLKKIDSYLLSPESHAHAAKHPQMASGPFMNFQTNKSLELESLKEKICTEQSTFIELADAIVELNNMLLAEGKGFSLEPLYKRIPDVLKGYVELVYDINSNPSSRFIEAFFYRDFNLEKFQKISLQLLKNDDRKFVLSTPVLSDENNVQIQRPFKDTMWTEFFRLKEFPGTENQINDILGFPFKEDLKDFFEIDNNKLTVGHIPVDEGSLRFRFFGHACVLLETSEVSILIDPLISYQYPSEIGRYTFADLPPKIDYILITHAHLDHLVLETLIQLRYKTKNIIIPKSAGGTLIDPSVKQLLNDFGFNMITEIDELESIILPMGEITSIPFLGEHHDLNIRSKSAYLIKLHGQTFLFLADSNNLQPEMFEHIKKYFGEIDNILLGMECDGSPLSWFYGHLLLSPFERDKNLSRRGCSLDSNRAFELIDILKCKNVYIYAMGLEPWTRYLLGLNCDEESIQRKELNKLVQKCKDNKINCESLSLKKEMNYN